MNLFDKQVKNTTAPDDCTLQDVYDFIARVYDFCIPENAEPGTHAFGLIDYYDMEGLGAWLKKKIEQDQAS